MNAPKHDRVPRPPREERDLHRVPRVELVMQRPREEDADEVGRVQHRRDICIPQADVDDNEKRTGRRQGG